jgi:hypothetical protein
LGVCGGAIRAIPGAGQLTRRARGSAFLGLRLPSGLGAASGFQVPGPGRGGRGGTRTGHRRRLVVESSQLVAESSQSTVALTSCQWGPAIDASIQTRKPPIDSRSPHSRFGRETGRKSPFPDSARTGKQGTPVSPADSAGNGNRGPSPDCQWPQIGKSGIPLCVSTSTACTILGQLDVALSPRNADSGPSTHTS